MDGPSNFQHTGSICLVGFCRPSDHCMMRTRLTMFDFAGVACPNLCWNEWVPRHPGYWFWACRARASGDVSFFLHPCPRGVAVAGCFAFIT